MGKPIALLLIALISTVFLAGCTMEPSSAGYAPYSSSDIRNVEIGSGGGGGGGM